MQSNEDVMPKNLVGQMSGQGSEQVGAQSGAGASAPGNTVNEEEWRAQNLPAEKLELRWRYANRTIQLYERRLRSLRAYNVGPAVQAWVRSRLEWVRDNKLYEQPDGVVVLSVDPEGDVDIQLAPQTDPPAFSVEDIEWEGGLPAACDAAGTLWLALDGRLVALPEDGTIRAAADSLARDLMGTVGYEVAVSSYGQLAENARWRGCAADVQERAELFAVSDEFGVVVCEGRDGEACAKLATYFEKAWRLER